MNDCDLNNLINRLVMELVKDEEVESLIKKSIERFIEVKLKYDVESIVWRELKNHLELKVKEILSKEQVKLNENLIHDFVIDSIRGFGKEMRSRLILDLRSIVPELHMHSYMPDRIIK